MSAIWKSPVRLAWLLAVAMVSVVFAAGCGDDEDDGGDSGSASGDVPTEVGEPEGEVNLVAWAGYVEDGSTDPKVDWVTPFEKETGCEVSVKVGNTSDEMVQLMRTGQYDGVSASGDATLRLIEGGDVSPVNTDLIPNYEDVFDALKDQPHNTVDGESYGVPHGRGANLLMWNPDEVQPDPTSWDVVFDNASDYSGQVTAYDNPIYIADAALYLMHHEPDLGIENPYELDQEQFDAAIELLKETTLPEEGATGWSDTWMISSEAEHPNCMYLWMDHIISPDANAQVAEWFGEAPANEKSCELTADPKHCETYHADDEEYFDQVYYWTTPVADCGDDRGEVCKTYDEWVQGWNEVKG
jgi:putative spermidine/putrescine transport system substrate-binding protein